MSCFDQGIYNMGPDEPGSAGDQYSHGNFLLWVILVGNANMPNSCTRL